MLLSRGAAVARPVPVYLGVGVLGVTVRVVDIADTLLPLEVAPDEGHDVLLPRLGVPGLLLRTLDLPGEANLLPVHDPLLVVESGHLPG